jgi:ribosomal protein L11 methylase PrmA
MRTWFVALLVLALSGAMPAAALDSRGGERLAQAQPAAKNRTPDVIYVPTPQEVVEDMLRLVDVKKGDVLYDLGCGDGRIPITAAKLYGVRAVGIDIDPQRIAEAQQNAKRAGVTHLVEFRLADLFQSDFREASVITLYLLPDLNVKLRPRLLAEMKPGTRIVSHQFDMGDWKPDKRLESNGRTIYFWVIPKRK